MIITRLLYPLITLVLWASLAVGGFSQPVSVYISPANNCFGTGYADCESGFTAGEQISGYNIAPGSLLEFDIVGGQPTNDYSDYSNVTWPTIAEDGFAIGASNCATTHLYLKRIHPVSDAPDITRVIAYWPGSTPPNTAPPVQGSPASPMLHSRSIVGVGRVQVFRRVSASRLRPARASRFNGQPMSG